MSSANIGFNDLVISFWSKGFTLSKVKEGYCVFKEGQKVAILPSPGLAQMWIRNQ